MAEPTLAEIEKALKAFRDWLRPASRAMSA
jgi:hypothetical protein